MISPVRKVVIPVAGQGTRMLPATKSVPKELLPVLDRPLIDYVVSEAFESGIEHAVLVTGRGKGAIENYFDHAVEIEAGLRQSAGRKQELESVVRSVRTPGAVSYVRQQAPLGLGHAIWCARHIIGDEPFAVSLPDEIVPSRPGYLAQMLEAYRKTGTGLVAVEEIDPADSAKYGMVIPANRNGNLIEISGMVEKPLPRDTPSSLRIIGRYILEPAIFSALEQQEKGAGGEIQLTDAMNTLAGNGKFHACINRGAIFDCGTKAGWLKTNVSLGLQRPEIREQLLELFRTEG